MLEKEFKIIYKRNLTKKLPEWGVTMEKLKTSYTIKSCILSKATKDGILVDRFFTVLGGEITFSEKNESQEKFFSENKKGKVSGRARLYPSSSQNDSIVEFIIGDSGNKKEIFSKNLVDIREVLKALKGEFGFRFTTIVKINGDMVMDLDLNNAPMNIGHVLKNPNPQTEVASREYIKKESQLQPQNPQMQMPLDVQPNFGEFYQQPLAQGVPQPPQLPQPPQPPQPKPENLKTNVAMGMTDRGALIVPPNKYVYPITFPTLVYNDLSKDPHNDAYTSKSSYRAEAVDVNGNISTYFFTETPEQIGLAREWIQYWIDKYGYLQLQKDPQIQQQLIQEQQSPLQPQNMPYQQGMPQQNQQGAAPFPLAALSKNPIFVKEAQSKRDKLNSINEIEMIKTSMGNLFLSKEVENLEGITDGEPKYDNELKIFWKLENNSLEV